MSTFADVAGAIRTRFAPLGIATVHDNAPEPAKAATWCRLRVDFTGTEQRSTGNEGARQWRAFGVVTAELYCHAEKGDGGLLTTAGEIAEAFRGLRLVDPHVRFFPPAPIGTSQLVGAWYRRDLRFLFEHDFIG